MMRGRPFLICICICIITKVYICYAQSDLGVYSCSANNSLGFKKATIDVSGPGSDQIIMIIKISNFHVDDPDDHDDVNDGDLALVFLELL